MKIQKKNNQGSAFVILLIVILVVGMWIVTLSDVTSSSSLAEGRRASVAMAIATADAGLARALGRWDNFSANGSTLPTPSDIRSDWPENGRAPDYELNPGVEMLDSDISLQYMDGLGRVFKETVTDAVIDFESQTFDTAYGKPAVRLSLIATARARVKDPVGNSKEEISVEVNRVYNRNSYPWPEGLAQHMHGGDPTTLMLHAGPNMILDGPIYTSKLIVGMTDANTWIFGNITSPPNYPSKSAGRAERTPYQIWAELMKMKNDGNLPDATGFFYNAERRQGSTSPFSPNQGNGVVINLTDPDASHFVRHIQTDESRYLFDTNDIEYWNYFGDLDGDGQTDNAYRDSESPNINGGYRELIERRGPGDETLFMASKRLPNLADLKIVYNSEASNFWLRDRWNRIIGMNPDAIEIYMRDRDPADAPEVPELAPDETESAAYTAAKNAAIEFYESKTAVPDYLKTALLKAMEFKNENFTDNWIKGNHSTFDGKMDIMNFDVSKLNAVLTAWTNEDPGGTVFGGKFNKSDFAYLPNHNVNDDDYRGYTIYVTDDGSDYSSTSGEFHKGIRLKNGTVVPEGGLVIATDLTAYVEGDFNTGGTGDAVETNKIEDNDHTNEKNYASGYDPSGRPSALWADSIRLLSSDWLDSKSTYSLNDRKAESTTYNLALIMGDFSQNSTGTDTGGLHNFPRFLEKWEGRDATIYGGMVRLWMSQSILKGYEQVPWSGNYYAPPDRHWSYDRGYLSNGGPADGPGKASSGYGRYWFTTGI